MTNDSNGQDFIVDADLKQNHEIKCRMEQIEWNYLEVFHPPNDLSIENKKIYKLVSLRQEISQLETHQSKIKKIERIHNCVAFERFMSELKRMKKKYPKKSFDNIVKHLFHGSFKTNPEYIYGCEDGFDIRFSNAGRYGHGIYFAKNSYYSHKYSYTTKDGCFQIMLALVLTGDSLLQIDADSSIKLPPLKSEQGFQRYDSINNGPGGHYIVYSNDKAYPGYLITYEHIY
ncbi:poly adp-ribose polymerase member 14-like protein [Stylonychia lemnae]|uniref:Poly [ADP-ribose] polymerase n=1 Tax=Stylonychia lemnae TaxID=5949 RepID=A0A078A9E0_STYLE|nr:poly adp-ribose polymerase member 14-like protein [Stylonychia lemnae]|eukprot:CDW77403.1 poly adp-ribose polymerase member 14-like protein [Stylonychia lemnae]